MKDQDSSFQLGSLSERIASMETSMTQLTTAQDVMKKEINDIKLSNVDENNKLIRRIDQLAVLFKVTTQQFTKLAQDMATISAEFKALAQRPVVDPSAIEKLLDTFTARIEEVLSLHNSDVTKITKEICVVDKRLKRLEKIRNIGVSIVAALGLIWGVFKVYGEAIDIYAKNASVPQQVIVEHTTMPTNTK